MDYAVERTVGEVEIRQYPPMVLARVRGIPDNDAFRVLFQYISGNNRDASKIEMTTPVITTGQRIAMTTPVMSDQTSFSFVLPASFSMETAPVPLDSRSSLEQMPPRRVAAMRFRGIAREGIVAQKTRQLLDALAEHEIAAQGEPFLMRYDAPYVPGFLRRNEVAVELTSRQ